MTTTPDPILPFFCAIPLADGKSVMLLQSLSPTAVGDMLDTIMDRLEEEAEILNTEFPLLDYDEFELTDPNNLSLN